MAIGSIPAYRYPLFDEWDKETFNLIKKWATDRNYPKVVGSQEEINQYLVTLIRTQKVLHDWRGILVDTINQIQQKGSIDTVSLVQKYPPESIGKDKPAWVTYEEDKKVSDFIDELESRKIKFLGSEGETGEFILRFILGQLGNDWELTILMIREMLGDDRELYLKDLNEEMKHFDYLNLFV